MNRRDLFKGLAGVAVGLILPPTLEENAEAGRRIWALGGIPKIVEPDFSFMDPDESPWHISAVRGDIFFERWARGFDGEMHLVQRWSLGWPSNV